MKNNTNVIRLTKRTLVAVALISSICALAFLMPSVKAQPHRIVYVVICVDTDMWGGPDQFLGSDNPHPTLDMRAYALSPPSTVSQVFDDAFRTSHRDSATLAPFKITWFAEVDYLTAQSNFVYADNSSAGVSGYTAILDLLRNNWGTKIHQYDDSIEWLHYFMIYDGVWQRYDSGPDAGYPDYHMAALDHMIIDSNFYPSTWRSGWRIMPPALSNWLEEWMPYDYTPDSGGWYPWHPFGMNRWQTHSGLGPNQLEVNATFAGVAAAGDYGRAIYSFSCHSGDNLTSQIDALHTYLTIADNDETTYPNVDFQYVTAKEAIQRTLFFSDFTEPTFSILGSGNSYNITSNEPIWNDQPYVAVKYNNGTYTHVHATPTGTNAWEVTLPAGMPLDEIGVAASDVARARHRVTFEQTGLDASATGPVVTVNGSAKTYADLPFSIWVDTGKSLSYSHEAIVPSNVSDTRYTLDTVTGSQSPIIVTSPTNITGHWTQQFQVIFEQTGLPTGSTTNVTVNAIPHTLPYSDWFDKDASINFTYEDAVSDATGTESTLTSTSTQSPLTLQAPTTVMAYYSTQSTQSTSGLPYTLETMAITAAIIIISGVNITAILYLKFRKPKPT